MNRRLFCMLVGLSVLVVIPQSVLALSVRTVPSDASLSGEPVTLKLKLSSRGVEKGPTFPLGPVEGRVGKTIELGNLKEKPERRAQLLVELPWGSYFKDVSPEALETGELKVTIHPVDDRAELTVRRHGVLIQPFPRRIMMREFIVVSNEGNGLVGGSGNPLRFDLPEDLSRIIPGTSMAGPEDLRKTDRGYVYQRKLPPGKTVLGFFYMVQPPEGSYSFRREIYHPTRRLVFSLPQSRGLEVEAEGLERSVTSRGPGGQERETLRFSASELASGDKVSLSFKGLSEVQPGGMGTADQGQEKGKSGDPFDRPSTFNSVSWPLMIGIGFSLLIFVGSYAYVQYMLSGGSATSSDTDFLVRELAHLDQEFDDGAIEEPFYRRTRRRWKNHLKELENEEST